MGTFARAAYIAQARNLDGSVVCKSAGALPFLLREGQRAHFVPPTLRGPRSAVVEHVEELRAGSWVVRFAGVGSAEDAEAIAGSYCLVAEDELPDVPVEDAPALLVGWSVVDEAHGELGTVDEVLESAAQATLSIAGERGQVLVPFVDAFVLSVDEGQRVVRTRIPDGLLELNRPGGAGAQAPAPERGERP